MNNDNFGGGSIDQLIPIPPGMTAEQAHTLANIAMEAHRQSKSSAVQKTINRALNPEPPVPEVISRTLVDKHAPINEGEWEFRLSGGVLQVIAWNDSKSEAHCVRFVRRGVEIHQIVQRQESEE